jgi:hypothetical protein
MRKSDEQKLEEIKIKQSQLKEKEQAIVQRKREAERKADTRRKIIIGGIWLKYFPEHKILDPKDENNFAEVVKIIASLSNRQAYSQQENRPDIWNILDGSK